MELALLNYGFWGSSCGKEGFCISNEIPGDADATGPQTTGRDEVFKLRVKKKDLVVGKHPGTLSSGYQQYYCCQILSHVFLHILTFLKSMCSSQKKFIVTEQMSKLWRMACCLNIYEICGW